MILSALGVLRNGLTEIHDTRLPSFNTTKAFGTLTLQKL
jgi:hypothetical protein